MSKKIRRIGILTSGGDAPGMNAVIRSVVRTAASKGIECVGIRRGYNGLITGDIIRLDSDSVSRIINKGGTMLYTARSEEFMTEIGQNKAAATCKQFGLDGIVAVGGDGTFRGLYALSKHGVSVVGIPATIDNDISCTNYCIGFDTAANTAIECIDKLRDTMQSHERCSVVEVMGRNAGYLALNAGLAIGATCILIPEVDYDIDSYIIERMKRTQKTGKEHFVIVVAEGVKGIDVNSLAKYIEQKTGVESRATVLGHVQRGGSPSVRDRVLASQMGFYAVQLLKQDIGNRVVVVKNDRIVDYDIIEALNMKKSIDPELYRIANEISI